MGIQFKRDGQELILVYEPEVETPESFLQRLKTEGVCYLRSIFELTEKLYRGQTDCDELT